MPTVSYGIANTADDVTAYNVGSVVVEPTLPSNGFVGSLLFTAGLRFLGVAVPQGATITAATLTLKKDAANSSAGAWGALKGVNSNSAPAWATTDPISAAKTTQSVAIVDGATQTYDVAAIVQSIVNRTGWSSGNALAFAGDPTGATGAMAWTDYGSSTTNCAQISITYTAGGPTNYTLPADARAFSLSGRVAGLKRSRLLQASARSFVLSGQAATLTRGRSIAANAATYALVGKSAVLRAVRSVIGGAGSVSLTGQGVVLRVTRLLSSASRSYVLTGNPALFETGKKLVGEKASFSLTGRAVGLVYQRRLGINVGNFAVAGQDATLDLVRKMGSEAGAFVIVGHSAGLNVSHKLRVEAGAYVLAGQDVGLVLDQGGNVTLSADRAVFVMAFGQASFRVSGWAPVHPASEVWSDQPSNVSTWTPVPKSPEVWS